MFHFISLWSEIKLNLCTALWYLYSLFQKKLSYQLCFINTVLINDSLIKKSVVSKLPREKLLSKYLGQSAVLNQAVWLFKQLINLHVYKTSDSKIISIKRELVIINYFVSCQRSRNNITQLSGKLQSMLQWFNSNVNNSCSTFLRIVHTE